MNIDPISMCYISMDSSRQALQTNRNLFSNFKIELTTIVLLWRRGGGICADQ